MSSSTSFPPLALSPYINSISSHLKTHNQTISVAETACGGLISASLLSLPGASAYFRGGLTVYSLESRTAWAGWREEDIKVYKGPTTEIVSNLARHTLQKLNTTYAIGESGTAGPTGGSTPNRTPGYVALAVVSSSGTVATRELSTGSADRSTNMVLFAEAALKLLLEVLQEEAHGKVNENENVEKAGL